jgi:hypothetical protein
MIASRPGAPLRRNPRATPRSSPPPNTYMDLTSSSSTPKKKTRVNHDAASLFSPCIVATTFLECLAVRNSKYQIPCHVPRASLPSRIGTVTEAPIRADLICAYSPPTGGLLVQGPNPSLPHIHIHIHTGISSSPSAECLYNVPFRSSGTILSNASDISARASSSQFSFRDRAQDVC